MPILLVLFVAGLIFAAVRRDRSLALGLTVLVVIAAEVISLSRLIGSVFVEIMQPTWVCGFGAALAAGWCLFSPLPEGLRRRTGPVLGLVLTIAVLGFGVANTVQAVQGPARPPQQDQVLERLADRAVPIAQGAHGPVLVQSNQKSGAVSNSLGPEILAATLNRHGVDVVVDPDVANRYGSFRAEPDRAVLELRLSPAADRPTGDGWQVVNMIDPLTAAQRAERDRLRAELDSQLGPTTTRAELLRGIDAHPELIGIARRYTTLADQPPLVLSSRPVSPSPSSRVGDST